MKRNKHSLSFYRLLSADLGALVPIGWFEVLPGDTVQHSASALVRAAPLLSPVMHPLVVRIHHWYVPNRLMWSGWEDFITGGPTGTDVSAPPTKTLNSAATVGSLADHLGVPTGVNGLKFSSFPVRAYYRIWNEWYRDQDLEASIFEGTTQTGGDAVFAGTNALQQISWEKDYFTSSRPWEQKGPQVTLPLGTSAPIRGLGVQDGVTPASLATYRDSTGALMTGQFGVGLTATSAFRTQNSGVTGPSNTPNITADLTLATAASVNQIRQAMAIQRFEEARARYGSRYVEYLRYLGVRSSDGRLQRPEYLGGGKQVISFSEVVQSGPSASPDQANVVGALKGHGIGALRSNRYRRFIEEHGIVISLLSVRPKTIYMNGLDRKFNRLVKEDYWQKELEHIGQQAVKNKEVYAAHATPDGTFGYQDRYDEYRRSESGVAGEFRSVLNYWHMARDFGSTPALNASFVSCVPTLRTFASSSTDPLYVMVNHSIQARRLVARSGKSYIF